ncbi:MAG: hypothetical protein ACRCWB_11930 [Enterovibrio sp.]
MDDLEILLAIPSAIVGGLIGVNAMLSCKTDFQRYALLGAGFAQWIVVHVCLYLA